MVHHNVKRIYDNGVCSNHIDWNSIESWIRMKYLHFCRCCNVPTLFEILENWSFT